MLGREKWRYLGVHMHMDQKYYMWENSLTGQRWAWYAPYYKLATTNPVYARSRWNTGWWRSR